ncbi:DNA binding domain-containing protein, excisionase family [Algoriella xinjiangensis]|uniref:DNA binding domain-containing protein, excisionase family n=1 Tax=Algoriella xinjiangensis TaxID=684065 RepID=A0A1I4W9M5_9FLAO|nr:helix-turn-helix domain-containing protein [Algoriella xinjiangensis]SFN10032.1 DNA binding domain-containing protein, excisionase family [Algoriella xinjiangensis]
MVAVDYNNMPEALSFLINQINSLKEQLKESARFNQPTISNEEEILSVKEVAKLLRLSEGTIRTKSWKGEIPVCKHFGKNYYLKSEIIDFIKKGKNLSNQEIEEQANQYLLTKKGAN